MIFVLYGIYEDLICLFGERKEAQLGVIEIPLDEMKLDRYLLTQQLGPIEKDLVVLKIIDILQLERRHACLPDDLSGAGAEWYILGGNDRIGQIWS